MRALPVILSLSLPILAYGADQSDVLEEVIVTATLREQAIIEVPISVSVLDAARLEDAGLHHFQDVLASVPNLHWAGATSRPRFFQIRGIGEREQYEGAPNPSVGFLIDDIDFSGIGMPATLLDANRIEVLRGPQGLRYGANALAGLVVMRSNDPADQPAFSTEGTWGDYGSASLGAVATAPVRSLDSAWRLAVNRYRSDGFRDDPYLSRDDTNDRDELTARAKWRWQPNDDTTVDLAWLHADLDNGYDGWSLDNTRRSLTDRPGKDAQRANGVSMRVDTGAGALGRLTVIAAGSDSDGEYSYDEDWGNTTSWLPFTYDYFYRALRERKTASLEAKVASGAPSKAGELGWVAGVYGLDLRERLDEHRAGTYIDPFEPLYSGTTDNSLSSNYDATNIAIFGQVDGLWSDRWGWSLGLRGEQRTADYSDRGVIDEAPRATDTDERDRMWGGQASVYFDPNERMRVFATLSRGYKAGGFNLGEASTIRPRFAPESLVSLDLGIKGEWFDRRVYADVTAFYMRREDMQVSTGIQLDPIGSPNSFFFLTDNAAGGRNYGLETSLRWRATAQFEFGASLGLLHTRYAGYRPEGVDVSDRDQAHAPEYTFAVDATWRHPFGWMARVDFAAIDDYYFDVPPADQRAPAYSLTHLKVGYEAETWSVYAWSRNVFDEEYVIRGFYFGNEPPNFENTRYTQLGEPRQLGVSVRWQW